MIVCPVCATEAAADQRFCGDCGSALVGECPACGAEHGPGQRFCGQCGTPLVSDARPPATARREEPEAQPVLEERRIVSVLFVDLVGFTAYSENRDPEEVRAMITEYFDVARQVVDRFGGTIDKFIGDAVMAWWGATASEEDDAERAVRAALEVVDRVTSLGERLGIPELAARAGVMTGEASVGPGGNERGLLLGDLVNSASRIQSLAAPGTVLVGATTADLVSSAIETAEERSHQVKGKEEPIIVWRAVRTLSERGGRGRATQLEPPFVGRGSELRLLKDSLHATGTDRRARLVSLVGQAGIGKSRLVWELRKYVDGLAETVYWHEGRSPSYGDGIALWALGEMIRQRAGLQEADDDATSRDRLNESVDRFVTVADRRPWILEKLETLLGLGDPSRGERSELFAATRSFFEEIARLGTVVLVFEDLHWADPSLLEFIEELVDWSQNHPILVVTMTRPDLLDRRPDWGSGRRGLTSLYLGPLTDSESRELVTGTVPGIPDQLADQIVAAAEGVPLFAVEIIRMLIGDGRLVMGDDGVTTSRIQELEIPTSVQAVISARLDRLPHEARELARDASVLGHAFTIHGLAALREEEPDKTESRLADLVRREVVELVRDPLSPERGQYRWVQSLLREVAYGRIGRSDRHQLHLRAARYFRDLDDPELTPVSAAHYLTARDLASEPDAQLDQELVAALQGAIERAQAVHAYEQVIDLVELAIGVFPPTDRIDLHEMGGTAAVRIQDLAVADRHVDALTALATGSSDPSLTHRAVAFRGWVANETRRSETARDDLEAHLEAHPELETSPDLARVAVYLARARLLRGDLAGAAVLADSALGAAEHHRMIEEVADAMVTRGTALVESRIHQGMALLRGALAICREHGLTATSLRALINIGYGSQDPIEIRDATEQALDEARRIGDRGHALFALGNLQGSMIQALDLDRVQALLDDPLNERLSLVDEVGRAVTVANLAIHRGDDTTFQESMERAAQLAAQITDPQSLGHVENQWQVRNFFDGDFLGTFRYFEALYHRSQFIRTASAFNAMEGAAMEGDSGPLATVGEMARELPPGPLTDLLAGWSRAMLILLSDPQAGLEAIRALDDECVQLETNRLRVIILAGAARALSPGDPARSELIATARHITETAGARGLTLLIDRFT